MEEIAEHPFLFSSCLQSAAEAVNSKELKRVGHHPQHPSFYKLPAFTSLWKVNCIPQRCVFVGDTWGFYKCRAFPTYQGLSPGWIPASLKIERNKNKTGHSLACSIQFIYLSQEIGKLFFWDRKVNSSLGVSILY